MEKRKLDLKIELRYNGGNEEEERKKMINFHLVYQAYEEYSKKYDTENPMILLKKEHMLRVAKINKRLAQEIGLEEEQIEVAEVIGLLHDIGRYEQVRRFHTFNDAKSVKHANLGVEILFQEGKIRSFIKDTKYDDIIKKAIYYHGQDKIDSSLQGIEKIHCQLIRDADKLDILSILTKEDLSTVCSAPIDVVLNGRISQEIEREFFEDHKIDYSKREEATEAIVCWLAYPFDIYFPQTMKWLKEEKYMQKIIKRFPFTNQNTKDTVNRMLKEVEEYMERKE